MGISGTNMTMKSGLKRIATFDQSLNPNFFKAKTKGFLFKEMVADKPKNMFRWNEKEKIDEFNT